MLIAMVVLWICIKLNAPAWCFVLLWIFTTLKIVEMVVKGSAKNQKGGR